MPKKNKKPEVAVGWIEATVGQVNPNEYLVEKILEKKQEDGEWKYLIKWVGWPSETNTWEPRAHLNCDLILSEFEKQWEIENQAKLSPELTPTPDIPVSAVKSNLGSASESSESDYLSGEDEKVSLEKTKEYLDFGILEECPPDKEPKCVVGVVDLSGHLTYLIDWKKNEENVTEKEDRSLIRANPFKLKYPQLVIDFYLKNISFNREPPSDAAIAERAAQALTAARKREAGDRADLEAEFPTKTKAEFVNLETSSDSVDSDYEVDNSA